MKAWNGALDQIFPSYRHIPSSSLFAYLSSYFGCSFAFASLDGGDFLSEEVVSKKKEKKVNIQPSASN